MWPNKILERFNLVPDNPRENDYYAPYNKLLYWAFPVDSDFTVAPQTYPIPESRDSVDFVVEYTILYNTMPVFILEIKEPSKLSYISSRHQADRQIRRRIADISHMCKIPILYAVSAFGTNISIYKKQGDVLEPKYIEGDVERQIDTSPIDRWTVDIITKEGYNKIINIFNYIKEETSRIEIK